MDIFVSSTDDPEDMLLIEPSFDIMMESAPDYSFTPRPSDSMSICKDSKVETSTSDKEIQIVHKGLLTECFDFSFGRFSHISIQYRYYESYFVFLFRTMLLEVKA